MAQFSYETLVDVVEVPLVPVGMKGWSWEMSENFQSLSLTCTGQLSSQYFQSPEPEI